MWLILLEAAAPKGQPGIWATLFPMVLFIAIFYFLIIRPQQSKQKQVQKMLDAVKVNDQVVTSGGMIGTIVTIKPDKNTVSLRVDDANGVKIEIQKSAIVGVLNEKKDESKS